MFFKFRNYFQKNKVKITSSVSKLFSVKMANDGNESNIPNDVILLLILNKIPGKMILDFAGLASKKF